MWKTVKLGDELSIARGGSPRPIKSFITDEDDGINWIKIGDTTQGGRYIESTKEKIKPSGVSRSRYVKSGDFLLSNSMSFGRPYILKTDGCIHDGWLVLSDYEETFTADYLYYLLSSTLVQNQFEKLARGSTVRNLNTELVSSVVVNVPPLAEQQRIVAKLDAAFAEIDRAVELAETSRDNAMRFYSHTIDALFNEYANQADTLGTLSTINYGYTAKASHEKGSYKFLRITDIQENNVDWETVPFCEVEEKKLEKVLLRDGDIVFARTGATTGKSFLVETPKDAVFASYLIRVSVDREKLNPRYVMHYFQSASYWKQVEEGISGAAQGGFNATKLGELKIPVIAKETQQALIAKLDDALESSKALDAIYTEKAAQLSQLKSAVLTQELQPSQSEAA